MTPEELVRAIPFRYITDALTPDEALEILRRGQPTAAPRARPRCAPTGYPGLHDLDRLARLLRTTRSAGSRREGVAAGWTHFKIKVGVDLDDDVRRARIVREEIGDDRVLMVDANQVWDVDEAIECDATRSRRSGRSGSRSRRAPTTSSATPGSRARSSRSGSASRPASTATTGSCSSSSCRRDAIGFCQIDSCRLGGVNEVLAVLLLAAKFGVPVCPHAGGVGLCEYVQHLAIFDYIAVSGSLEDRVVEYVDHLHEHFVDPVVVRDGRYVVADGARLQHHDAARVAASASRSPDGPTAWTRPSRRRAVARPR